MSNKYLEQLENLNQELSKMTDDELSEVLKDIDLDPKDYENYAQLEKLILNIEKKESK